MILQFTNIDIDHLGVDLAQVDIDMNHRQFGGVSLGQGYGFIQNRMIVRPQIDGDENMLIGLTIHDEPPGG